MSRLRLLGGLAVMWIGVVLFVASAISLFDLLRPGDAAWNERLWDAILWVVYGIMTTWCAVVASGQGDGDAE